MHPRLPAIALTVALLAAAAIGTRAPAATTADPWSAPLTVSRSAPGRSPGATALAVGASGRALATWSYRLSTGHAGQRSASRPAGGAFGPARELGSAIEAPLVYERDRVVALVRPRAWRPRRVRVVFGSTSGAFGPEHTIYRTPPATGGGTRIAVGGNGRIAVVHRLFRRDGSSRIVLLERSRGRDFGPPTLVDEQPVCRVESCRSYDGGGDVSVAAGPRGDLVVAWQAGPWVVARMRPAGGRMGPVVRVGLFDRIWGRLRTAVSVQGAMWIAWFDHPVESGDGPMSIRVATRPAGAAAFGPLRELDHVDEMDFLLGQTVRLALDPAGTAYVAWHGPGAKLAVLDAGGEPLRRYDLGSGDILDLATSRRPGEALVLWAGFPDYIDGRTQIQGALITPQGGFSGPEAIGPFAGIRGGSAALDPVGGSAIVVWPQDKPADSLTPDHRSQSVIRAATRSVP